MTAEQFWKGDPYLAVAYREADLRRREQTNVNLWLQGRYIYDGIFSVVHNAFSKKGTKAVWYPDEPYKITPPTEEEEKAKAEAERQKAIKSLNAWKQAWDRQHG